MQRSKQPRAPIAAAFARARAEERVALIPYVMAGYPDLAMCEALAFRLDQAGADIVELGVPFSDPLADGATIQAASQRALEQGVTLEDTLVLASRLSERMRAPPVLMTYYNPIYSFGVAHFCEAASAAGVAGVIVPDLPPEEAEYLQETAAPYGLELIFLVAPTTTPQRIGLIAAKAGGFIYYVALKGVTGAMHLRTDGIAEQIARIRSHTDLPIMIGFGIKDGTSARMVAPLADGVVLGTSLVTTMERAQEVDSLLDRELDNRAHEP